MPSMRGESIITMTFMAQRFMSQISNCKLYKQVKIKARHGHMSLWLKKRARCTRCPQVKGEVAVTAGFIPFKVPGSPVVEKTVFPSPLSFLFFFSRDCTVVVFRCEFIGTTSIHMNLNNISHKLVPGCPWPFPVLGQCACYMRNHGVHWGEG